MRAAVAIQPRQPLEIQELQLRTPGDKEVLVRTLAVGVCHSDVAPWEGGRKSVQFPVVCGHELAGVVEAVGAGVSRVKVGDQVVGSPWPYCGTCFYCIRGHANFCEGLGPSATNPPKYLSSSGDRVHAYALGAFAEQTVLSEFSVVPVRSDLPAEQLALVGCAVLTGFGAVFNVGQVQPGAVVLVAGCGGVGQMVVKAADIAGAARIIAVDTVPMKRDAALKNGATEVIDPADGDLVELVRAVTDGRGVDIALEVVGNPELLMAAHRATRPGGRVVAVGTLSEAAEFRMSPLEIVHGGGKALIGCKMGGGNPMHDIQAFADLASSGRYSLSELISKTRPLGEIQAAFDDLLAGNVIRTVLTL
jgi:S-(hydroxymethyl)glutathione dehydrogenase/alcohol dehydrogenase